MSPTCISARSAAPRYRSGWFEVLVSCALACALTVLSACTHVGGSSNSAPFSPQYRESAFNDQAARIEGDNAIDVSHANDGYLAASATNENRLKLEVSCGGASYSYDLPNDGTPIVVPANLGSGAYTIRIMQNTSGEKYVEIMSETADVQLADETIPFVYSNVFCSYDEGSAVVAKSRELCANAQTEEEAFEAVFRYVRDNITYDHDKAARWATSSGYVPNPDETLDSGSGICFDYASLTAALLRAQGIPCKIVTGSVAPDNIYHAWDMIYIDGSWITMHVSAPASGWSRADITLSASGAGDGASDDKTYTDRYTY